MKMKLALLLLLLLVVGVLARSPALTSSEAEEAVDELSERYVRSASDESSQVAPGGPPGKSREGDLEAVSKEAGMNGSGMSGESESENSNGTKSNGGKSKESGEDGDQLNSASNTDGTGDTYAIYVLKHLASILGLDGINQIPDLVAKYYSGSLPISIETLLKTLGITASLQEMQNTSSLYQLMNSIPIVGTIVNFMTNSLFIPINIIALILFLVTTTLQHMYNALPSIL